MRKFLLIAAVVGGIGIAVVGIAPVAQAQGMMGGYGGGDGPGTMMGGYGPGSMMGPGYGGGYGPGYAMPQGYGPGSYHHHGLNLSVDDVKAYLQRMIRNPNLKVGDVEEKDADTITADVVTKDNSLVRRFDVNRHSGFFQPEQ